MNTKRIFALLVAGLFTTSILSAAGQYECCDPCDTNRGFFDRVSVGADVLFWSAYTPSLEFVRHATPSPAPVEFQHQRWQGVFLEHYFDPGFRVYAGLEDLWCGWDLYASYTWYKSTDHKVIFRNGAELAIPVYQIPALYPFSLTGPDRFEGRSEIEYQSFDALFGYDFECFGPCHTMGAFVGVEGVKFDQHKKTFVDLAQAEGEFSRAFTIDWKSEFQGIGPKIGTQYEWLCCNCLKWFASGSFSVLVGDREDTNFQELILMGGTTNRTIKDCNTLCVPGFHLAAGLDYSTCYCGWDFGVRAGYEFISWWNIPRQRTYQSGGYAFTTSAAGGNLVLHGLFAGAYVNF